MILAGLLAALTACEKDNTPATDPLLQSPMIGMWKLETRFVNNISDLAVACCDYLEFNLDADPNDLKGRFAATGAGYETLGQFELITETEQIRFQYEDNTLLYDVQFYGDVMTLTYQENDAFVEENWRKQ